MNNYICDMKTNLTRKIVLCLVRYAGCHYELIQSYVYLCLRLKKIPPSYLEYQYSIYGVYSIYVEKIMDEIRQFIYIKKLKREVSGNAFANTPIIIIDPEGFDSFCLQYDIQTSSFKHISILVSNKMNVETLTLFGRYVAVMDLICLKTRCLDDSNKIDKDKLKTYVEVLDLYRNESFFNLCYIRLKRFNLKYIR